MAQFLQKTIPAPMTFIEIMVNSPLIAVYFLCAVFGGTLIILQFLLMMVGFGGADESDFGDATDHASHTDIFKILSLRTVVAGIAFFGLGGLAGLFGGLHPAASVVVAVISGLIAIYAVYYLYWSAGRLKEDGSLTEKTLLGAAGSVYVRIPPAKTGVGKVLVCQQGRTVEYEAVTAGDELKTTAPIVVIGIVSSTTVEVVSSV